MQKHVHQFVAQGSRSFVLHVRFELEDKSVASKIKELSEEISQVNANKDFLLAAPALPAGGHSVEVVRVPLPLCHTNAQRSPASCGCISMHLHVSSLGRGMVFVCQHGPGHGFDGLTKTSDTFASLASGAAVRSTSRQVLQHLPHHRKGGFHSKVFTTMWEEAESGLLAEAAGNSVALDLLIGLRGED